MTHEVTDNNHLFHADKETAPLKAAHNLASQIDDILRHIEYADVSAARQSVEQLLGELVDADRDLAQNIQCFENGETP